MWSRPPLGTTFSFTLNTAATARLDFRRHVGGRKAGKRCVKQTRGNRHEHRCSRTIAAGTLSFPAHAGVNAVRFAGRISPSHELKPGRYTLLITATSTTGPPSTPKTLSFTIVKG